MLETWRYYKDLIIDHNKIDSDLTDFSVVVKLDSSNFNFNRAQSTGNDIRFVLPNRTILSYEREQHDSANQKAVYWVKIPTAYSSVDTPFRMYFGNPSATDGADPTNVWDGNFAMVQHMYDNPDTSHIKDSTANGNDGTKTSANNPIEADGMIGKAQDFGGDDEIIIPDSADFDLTGGFLIESMVNVDDLSSERVIISKFWDGTTRAWHLEAYDVNANIKFLMRQSGDANDTVVESATNSIQVATDYYVSILNDGSNYQIYINGVASGSPVPTKIMVTNNADVNIGDWSHTSLHGYMDGKIDEVRVSSFTGTARSPAYIKANDYNLRLNTLLTYGATRANTNSLFFASNF